MARIKKRDGLFSPEELLNIRLKTGLNQRDFWGALGYRQSTGSRYESGAIGMLPPLNEMVRLVYVEGVDLARVTGLDLAIVRELKKKHPDIFQTLSETVLAAHSDVSESEN